MKKRFIMGLSLLCMAGLCAYIGASSGKNFMKAKQYITENTETENSTADPESMEAAENTELENTDEITEPENPPSEQIPWQVSICPDMPEPYVEVLKQYESYLSACAADAGVESVLERLWGGEWEYVFYEIGTCAKEANPGASLCYALKDLTGNGFPELIVAKYGTDAYPYAVYNYSEEKGVKMFEVSSYFSMLFYETGIMEIDSAGAGYSTITYLQYQEDVQDWVILDKIAVNRLHDSDNPEYFKGVPGESGDPKEPISEAEYLQIGEKYAAEPVNLKWNPLVHDKADPWYFYKEDEELIYMHDFISSRDGQGFHWWIYLEATYVMLDYGKRIGYDFMSDHWMVEHIWPIEGGCYNILLSQDNHDVVLDLLCQPEDRKYVIVYAQYENGDRRAGYNDAVSFDSQLEWTDFDYNTPTPEAPSKVIIENPFGDIYETSIYQPCYSALHQYMQDTGYNGKWQIRQVFGRAPFWDYLAESENGFLWVCSDLDYFTYVPLPKPDTTGQ